MLHPSTRPSQLLQLTKQRTVPNVWIKGQHIGGADDTIALAQSGELQRRIGMPITSPEPVQADTLSAPSAATGKAFHVAYGAS